MKIHELLTRIVREKIQEEGEAPTNVVGAGNVAGTGVGPQGEPPGQTALMKKLKMMKRKTPNVNVAG